jgi:hypothetical protein
VWAVLRVRAGSAPRCRLSRSRRCVCCRLSTLRTYPRGRVGGLVCQGVDGMPLTTAPVCVCVHRYMRVRQMPYVMDLHLFLSRPVQFNVGDTIRYTMAR